MKCHACENPIVDGGKIQIKQYTGSYTGSPKTVDVKELSGSSETIYFCCKRCMCVSMSETFGLNFDLLLASIGDDPLH